MKFDPLYVHSDGVNCLTYWNTIVASKRRSYGPVVGLADHELHQLFGRILSPEDRVDLPQSPINEAAVHRLRKQGDGV